MFKRLEELMSEHGEAIAKSEERMAEAMVTPPQWKSRIEFEAFDALAWFAAAALVVALLFAVLPVSAQAATPAAQKAAVSTGSPVLDRILASGTVRIGARAEAMPFAYTLDAKPASASNKPVGYSIELCEALVQSLAREHKKPLKVEFVPVTAANRFAVMAENKADVECGATINNAKRRAAGDVYALPIFFDGPRLLTRTSSGIGDWFSLRAGSEVVVARRSNAHDLIEEKMKTSGVNQKGKEIPGLFTGINLHVADDNSAAFARYRKNDAGAVASLETLLLSAVASMPEAERSQHKVVASHLAFEPVGFLLPRGDPKFVEAVNRQLAHLMIDGVVERLYRKWFMAPVPTANGAAFTFGIPLPDALRTHFFWPNPATGDQ